MSASLGLLHSCRVASVDFDLEQIQQHAPMWNEYQQDRKIDATGAACIVVFELMANAKPLRSLIGVYRSAVVENHKDM